MPMISAPGQLRLDDTSVLLRGETAAIAGWMERWDNRRFATQVMVIVLGAGLYGAAMGWWRGPEQALYVAIKFPLIILLTMGGEDWHSAVAAAKRHVNLYLEISGTLDSDKIAYATSMLTPRKVLYGSCLPYSDPQLTIGLVEETKTLTANDRNRVYYQNAQQLFIVERESD